MRRRTRFGESRRPAGRRPEIVPGRRSVVVLALVAFACFGGGPAAAYENDGQQVTATVYQSGQAPIPDSVSVGTLEGDPEQCPTYSGPDEGFIGPGGDTELPASSWSLASVLGCLEAPIQISNVAGITIIRADGAAEASLGPDDLTVPSDFADPNQVPVISSDGDGIIYNRPKRPGNDDNAADRVEDDNPDPFEFDVFEGPSLTVVATASQTTVSAGATINFDATATGQDDSGLSFSWNFAGGGSPDSSTSQDPEVAFQSAGTYPVTVVGSDAAGGGGEATITINVVSGTTTPTTTSTTPTGPQGSKGSTPGGTKGKRPVKKSATSGTGHSGKHGVTSRNPSAGLGTATPAATTATTTTTAANASPVGSVPGLAGAPRSTTRPTAAIAPSASPQLVIGRLISDVTPLPPGTSPLVRVLPASPGTAPSVRPAVRPSILPALGVALAILLLFSLGAGRELRWRRGWNALRFGS